MHLNSGECPNCTRSYKPTDLFCAHCGQSTRSSRVDFKHLVTEALGGLYSFDGKNWNTAITLISRPGLITKHFIEGKLARYAHPIRLYLFVSFVFFIILKNDRSDNLPNMLADSPSDFELDLGGDTTLVFAEVAKIDPDNLIAIDSVLQSGNHEVNWFNRLTLRQFIKFQGGGLNLFQGAFLSNMSLAMFLLIPVMGAIFWLLTRGSKSWFVDCLVFSLHFQTFIFIWLAINSLLGLISIDFPTWVVVCLPLVYLTMAFHVAFESGWPRSVWRTVAFTPLYGLALISAMVITALVSLLTF